MNHSPLDNSQELAKERAERLRRLRNLANLSRKELCDRADININTYIGYEVGRYGGLTQKGADKIIPFIATKGVYSTSEWLMYGVGPSPHVITNIVDITQKDEPLKSFDQEEKNIVEELHVFHKHYKSAIDCRINDDGMSPKYDKGDFVAGIRHSGLSTNDLIGMDSIVQIEKGVIFVRWLCEGRTKGTYTLMCCNPKTSVVQPIRYDIKIIFAAPIIWHRRLNKVLNKNSHDNEENKHG
ncbi:MAG TPA: hypothetical protein VJN02_09985 [Gammaproteobacteria bacterium]|nr:hypothetical protein [Gammaproteobacteria bacterium]